MNLGNSFLLKFLMILFSFEGSVSTNDTIHSYIGNQIILPGPKYPIRLYYLIWTKNKTTFIAEYSNNSIIIPTKQPEPNKYHLFLNGSLKINRLKKMDAGNYEVGSYNENGRRLGHGLITLQVNELQPKLNELCSQRTLICEVKSEEPKPRFKLFQDTKEIKIEQPEYDNATWKVTLQLKVLSGKFRCEIDVNSEKNHTEKQITCSGEDLLDSGPMSLFLILIIMGSVVASIIILALIIYCIIRKKAKRCEREAEEYALQMQINSHMQQRKLPEIPVSSGSNSPYQKSRSPPSELQQQIGPSKSCPHPKPPRRIKKIP